MFHVKQPRIGRHVDRQRMGSASSSGPIRIDACPDRWDRRLGPVFHVKRQLLALPSVGADPADVWGDWERTTSGSGIGY